MRSIMIRGWGINVYEVWISYLISGGWFVGLLIVSMIIVSLENCRCFCGKKHIERVD